MATCKGAPALLPRPEIPIRVALLSPNTTAISPLYHRLEECPDLQVAICSELVIGTEWDVVTADATAADLDCVRFVVREWGGIGMPELVVTLTDPRASTMHALAHFGLEHIMTLESACGWMPTAVRPLADLARARRAAKRAADALAKMPPPPHQARGLFPLFPAESAFREAYLRTLTALYPTVREAASAAGVPYRSFQRMLTEIGIRRKDAQPRQEKPSASLLPSPASPIDSISSQAMKGVPSGVSSPGCVPFCARFGPGPDSRIQAETSANMGMKDTTGFRATTQFNSSKEIRTCQSLVAVIVRRYAVAG